MARTIEVRSERDTVVVNVRESVFSLGHNVIHGHAIRVHGKDFLEPHAQGQHLKPAAVSERGPGPVHEGSKTPGRLDDVRSRLQIQVISVR